MVGRPMIEPETRTTPPLRRLDPSEHALALAPLAALEMNTLFARAVVSDDAPGAVFADRARSPSTFYVVHGYGMSLLLGSTGAPDLDDAVAAHVLARERTEIEWLQISSTDWATPLAKLSPALERDTRVNFAFSAAAYRRRRPSVVSPAHAIARVDRSAFAMSGSVVPRAFWRDADSFLARGAGFAVMAGGRPVSIAFSSFVTSSQLEIGIETLEGFRGRGLATHACVALIDDCLARGLEPVWACRLGNTASHRLAEALGFVAVRWGPYFRLG